MRKVQIFFLPQGRLPVPALPRDFLHFYTMILQRIKIIVRDAGFEPGTSEFFSGFLLNEKFCGLNANGLSGLSRLVPNYANVQPCPIKYHKIKKLLRSTGTVPICFEMVS